MSIQTGSVCFVLEDDQIREVRVERFVTLQPAFGGKEDLFVLAGNRIYRPSDLWLDRAKLAKHYIDGKQDRIRILQELLNSFNG